MWHPTPTPFRLHVADEILADLRDRLARTRFPEVPPQPPWSTGTSVTYMRDLSSYWHDRFDWRMAESNLNSLRQFKVSLAGIDLHFIHE